MGRKADEQAWAGELAAIASANGHSDEQAGEQQACRWASGQVDRLSIILNPIDTSKDCQAS